MYIQTKYLVIMRPILVVKRLTHAMRISLASTVRIIMPMPHSIFKQFKISFNQLFHNISTELESEGQFLYF